MAFADTYVGDAHPVGNHQPGMLDSLLSTGYLAAIYGYYPLGSSDRPHHAVDVRADTGQAVNPSNAQRVQAYCCLVGYLAAVGATRAGE